MKILRLSLFNIRKHKVETISLFFLLMLSMVLLVLSVSGIAGMDQIVRNAYDKTGSYYNVFNMPVDDYKDIYYDYLDNDERVTGFDLTTALYETNGKYLDKNGDEAAIFTVFITEDGNKAMQNLELNSSKTMDEIRAMEHFIIMPYFMKDSMGFYEGDEYVFVYNEKAYPFHVAGFYEASVFADSMLGVKMMISDADYNVLNKILPEYAFLAYSTDSGTDMAQADIFIKDFIEYAEENAVLDETENIGYLPYYSVEIATTATIKMLMGIMLGMSLVVFAAVLFMMAYRIKCDIDEQIVSIGVLEALGHATMEIQSIYILEYLVIAVVAVIVGLIASIFTVPLMGQIGEIMTGHHSSDSSVPGYCFVFGLVLILFVVLAGFISSRRVKKYPPVVAFRKGMCNHTHRKNVLPLEKTRSNVHIRLSAKNFLSNMKTNIGVGLCMAIAALAMTACLLIKSYMGNGVNALIPVMNIELPDVKVEAMTGVDVLELQQEILSLPEVRKVNIAGDWISSLVNIDGIDSFVGHVIAYKDYEDIEYIHPNSGRFPKHDNECMLTETVCNYLGIDVGDIVRLKNSKVEVDYMVCGKLTSVINGGGNIYMTDAAYAKVCPGKYLNQMEIYLNEGVDKKEFKGKLYALYGTPGSEVEKTDMGGASLEDRIRAEAESKIGTLLEMYDVDSVDYAIMIGNEMIAGNSNGFKIRAALDIMEIVVSQMANTISAFAVGTAAFVGISIVVIMVIIFILVIAAVRNRRSELGILKGMGYTSGELMLQIAAGILPTLVIGVFIGSLAGYAITDMLFVSLFGKVSFHLAEVLLMDAIVCIFGFVTAIFSARRIKNISVYELMQE